MARKPKSDGFRIISEEATKKVLETLHEPLFRIATGAWGNLQRKATTLLQRPSKKFLSVTMHEFLEEEARTRLDDLRGVRIIESDRFLVNVRNQVLLQFKKVDHDLKSQNYPTPAAIAFDQQQELPGIPWLPRITLGYQPNETWTNLLCVAVLLRRGDNILWSYEIDEDNSSVVQFPMAPSPLPPKVIVKPKAQVIMKFIAPPAKKD